MHITVETDRRISYLKRRPAKATTDIGIVDCYKKDRVNGIVCSKVEIHLIKKKLRNE